MQFANVVQLSARRDEVWAYLQDPHTMEHCIPGLEQVEISEGGRVVSGVTRLSLGPTTVRLPARVEWMERCAPEQGKLRVLTTVSDYEIEGMGSVALAAQEDDSTELSWEVEVRMPPLFDRNSMLANMVRLFVSRFTKEFFTCVEAHFSRFDTAK
ncbi:MAG TPA: SRPBCC domain-containing protein [Candidatus Sulfomarinibacteraceae bacterium]|nr:SRPBCC domain-containing protein [Candidatus Sulfomarinibacteraceae bacterium]